MYETLSPSRQKRLLRALTEEETRRSEDDWSVWGHGGQHPPGGDWRTWIVMAGRGYGKTRAGAEWVRGVARDHPGARIALVAASMAEARAVMIDGESGLLAVAGHEIAVFTATRNKLVFTSGAEAMIFSGASPERLRGFQHHFAWCDELAKWRRASDTWDMLQLGLRLGDHPRTIVTTTPRAGPVLVRIMDQNGTVTTSGPTVGNPHLPPAFVAAVTEQYAGTRLGRQELDGELLTDVENALWTVELLERCRFEAPSGASGGGRDRPSTSLGTGGRGALDLVRVVIGVDPPAGAGTCGIVACARDARGRGHVLADHSVAGRSPERWARAVAAAAEVHRAQLVVAERNQGGEMVRSVLRAADAGLRVKLVHASEGKSARAAPVHTLFEAGKVTLHGIMPELEAELRGLKSGGGYEAPAWVGPGGPGASPDRADAMVWALTELMLGARAEARIRAL